MDLRSCSLTINNALATVVWILDNLYIRVGNAAYAEANKSYGLMTLRSRHVTFDGGSLKFRFTDKSGKEWNFTHSDLRIANFMRNLQELPGQHLFQCVCDEGGCRPISSHDVNAYIREVTGDDCKRVSIPFNWLVFEDGSACENSSSRIWKLKDGL